MISQAVASIRENGMIYKEITQWLRQRAFGAIFIGLLALCEMIAVLFGTLDLGDPGSAGTITFGLLTGLLFLYGVVLALSGHITTAREFNDHTFELYALAGMSLERMVLGKLLSFMTAFFFGACCIVPYQFFAYLLGGIDFYTIIGTLLLAFLSAPVMFLAALLVAAYQKNKAMRVLSRMGSGLLLFLLGPWLLIVIISSSVGSGGPALPITFYLKALLEGEGWAWASLGVGSMFYAQLVALQFYLCAHAMRPTTDSREHIVKGLSTSLLGCILLLFGWLADAKGMRDGYQPAFLTAYLLLCGMGLSCFYGPLAVPVIIRRRHETLLRRKSPLAIIQRWLFYWFEPGPLGLLRTYFVNITLLLIFGAWIAWMMTISVSSARVSLGYGLWGPEGLPDFVRWLSYPAIMPFFMAFPAIIFYAVPKLARSKTIAGMVVVFWLVSGTILSVISGMSAANRRFMASAEQYIMLWIAAALSPMSSITAESWGKQLNLEVTFWPLRYMLGGLGLVLMWRIIVSRRKDEAFALRADAGKEALPDSVAMLPAPPPIPEIKTEHETLR